MRPSLHHHALPCMLVRSVAAPPECACASMHAFVHSPAMLALEVLWWNEAESGKLPHRELRARGVQVTRSAGSDLIVALCRAEQPDQALRVYEDMTASAWGAASSGLAPGPAAACVPVKPDLADLACAAGTRVHPDRGAVSTAAEVPEQPSHPAASPAMFLQPAAHDGHSPPQNLQREDEVLPVARLQLKGPPQRPPAGGLAAIQPPQQAGNQHQTARAGHWDGAYMRSSSDYSGPGQAGSDGQLRQPKQAKLKPAVIPHIAALGALVGALARANDVDAALRMYAQVWPPGKRFLHACALRCFLAWSTSHALQQLETEAAWMLQGGPRPCGCCAADPERPTHVAVPAGDLLPQGAHRSRTGGTPHSHTALTRTDFFHAGRGASWACHTGV